MIAGALAALMFVTAAGRPPSARDARANACARAAEIAVPEIAIPEMWLPGMVIPEIRLPEIQLPGIVMPPISLPEIEIPSIDLSAELADLADLPRMAARATPRGRDRDEDADSDEDEEAPRDEHGARIYKMNPQPPRIRIPNVRIDPDRDDWDERNATAQSSSGHGSATLKVKAPVTFQLRAQSGDIEVVTSDRQQVSIALSGSGGSPDDVALYAFGDRVEPSFHGRRTFRHGKLRVELPTGSRLDLSSLSGDVRAQKLSDVRIRTMSGDVKLSGVGKADVQTVSGDVRIDEAQGTVRLHTVSGHATIASIGPAPHVEFQSASGDMDWTGMCAKDCHLSAETVSGSLRLAVDPKSSFELNYTSHSGELRDQLDMTVKRAPRRRHGTTGGWLEATFGRGEGVIEADAFSGNLAIRRK